MKRIALALAVTALLAAAPTDAAAQNRTDTQTIRTWEERVKIGSGSGTETHRVELAFDYAQGVTLRRTFDAAGRLLRTEALTAQPRPSDDEIAEATALIAADAEIAPLLAASGATIEGGFVYHQADFDAPLAACGPGARCLQFDLVAPSRLESVRFVVVDLATRQVVERDLFPNL